MDIDLLNEFIILSKCLNYSKAADQLFISQSVLSRHIQGLENQLGVLLFTRDKHSVTLTPIGEVFARDADKIIEQYQRAMKHVQMSKDGVLGELEIVSSQTLSTYFMYDFMIEFTKKYPHIKINVSINDNGTQTAMDVKSRRKDIGIILDWPEIHSAQLRRQTFFKDQLYMITAPEHPLAQRTSVTVEDLSGIPMIYFNQKENLCAAAFFEELFARNHAQYNACIEAANLESMFFKILSENGVSIISAHIFKFLPPNINVVKIDGPDTAIDVDLIWSPDSDNNCLPIFLKEFSAFAARYRSRLKDAGSGQK